MDDILREILLANPAFGELSLEEAVVWLEAMVEDEERSGKRQERELAVIEEAAAPFGDSVPLAEIFDLLRKQPKLSRIQQRALDIWDGGNWAEKPIEVESDGGTIEP